MTQATRWAACVQYRGQAYSGWQRQAECRSVQAEVERALSSVANAAVTVACAGRTDAGVHAVGQIVSFDSSVSRPARAWLLGANSQLPGDISLNWVHPVPASFHARFSALGRRYRYLAWNSKIRSALAGPASAWIRTELDADIMNQAAQVLVGEQDFSAFRAAQCQSRTPMRCVFSLKVWRSQNFVVMDIHANAFLHHMVRNIMGSLMEIGQGRHPVQWVAELLAARDRTQAGPTAPAGGLYFLGPEYAPRFELPPLPSPLLP